MSNCPDYIIEYMHEHLDEEIEPEHEQVLMEHLRTCENCRQHFHELKKTVVLIQGTAHIQTPEHITDHVMALLPGEKGRWKRWFNKHPLLTAAAVFVIFMMISAVSVWNQSDDFSVTKHDDIIIEENNTAVIREGEIVEGDIVVKNGNIRIEGKVNGDVTIINGEKYMASAGEVTGEIKEINELFDWLWFTIKDLFKKLIEL